jgi:tetraacyldisaccharide 4'-kinase
LPQPPRVRHHRYRTIRFLSWQGIDKTVFAPGSQVRWWLLWAGVLYGMAGQVRAWLYRQGWLAQRRLPVPVVSIGNLTVGGTGKTPMVISLAEWLLTEGKRVAILSRGYGRAGRESMLLVSDGARVLAGPQEAGDEPHLIAQRCPQAVVAVGSDRYELGRWVLEPVSSRLRPAR